MSLKLSDNDRTLLSAYMDGELSPDELRRAEQLLGGSPEARTYLGHLRSVRSFSTAAFPTVSAGLAGAAAGKLSGGAITATAKKSAMIKGFTLGGWGTTGLVAAAASVVVGVALSGGGDRKAPVPSSPRATHRAAAPVATPMAAAATPIDVDTNALLVPPMTPSEMVRFAVNGTVPIDAKRKQYLTLASHGDDSMVVALRDNPPADEFVALDEVEPSDWRELDSVHRAIRTSLLNYGNKGIAISCDIPSLRLKALEHLERIGPKLPANLREELEAARRQVDAARESLRVAESARARNTARWSAHPRVPYVVLSFEQIEPNGAPERFRIPDPVNAPTGSYNVMLVDGAALDELRAMTPVVIAAPPAVFTSGTVTTRHLELRQRAATRAFNPTGELPPRPPVPPEQDPEDQSVDQNGFLQGDGDGNLMINSGGNQLMINGNGSMIKSGGQEVMINNNNGEMMIRINGDTIVHKVRNALRVADSTLQRLNREMPALIIKNGKGVLRDGDKVKEWKSQESDEDSVGAGSAPR